MQLAQFNIAKMRGPLESPVMKDFTANIERINQIAEQHPGFIWRLKGDSGDATSIQAYSNPDLLINMSVWKDIESLFDFTYKSGHLGIFKRKKEWMLQTDGPHMVMWYVDVAHIPDLEEAKSRLDHLAEFGESPYAFSFRKRYSVSDYENYLKEKPAVDE